MSGIQQMLLGGSAYPPLPGGSSTSSAAGGNANVNLSFQADGSYASAILGTGSTVSGRWHASTTPPASWIRATLSSGTAPTTGTLNTWLSLASVQTWGLLRTTVGSVTNTLLIQIALDAAGTSIVSSGSFTQTSTKTS